MSRREVVRVPLSTAPLGWILRRSNLFVLLALVCGSGASARAQVSERIEVRNEVFAGGELERYLRLLQVDGQIALYPWSIRGFSPAEVDRLLPGDSVHPWGRRYDLEADTGKGGHIAWVRPRTDLIYNSAFAYGSNDGAVWAGRGLTASVQMGISARYGPLSLTIAPVAFWSQNADFELIPNGQSGEGEYRAWQYPWGIDLPQRFGDEPYGRIDPGQSTLRLDVGGLAVGASTANQVWGPAGEHPVLLGNNAPGFAHVFLGTARPVDLWVGRLHGRVVYGRLQQSEFSPALKGRERRFMSGAVAVFSPRWLEGLELGGGRFFHSYWPEEGLSVDHLLRPFEGFLKVSVARESGGAQEHDAANQLVSAFARWVVPGSDFEIYGEFGREDHSWDLRHFLLEPDDIGAYLLGFSKLFRRSDGNFVAVRGEVLNSEISHLAMSDRARGQTPMYQHIAQQQGHTQRGQLLASAAGYGGGGSLLAVDLYHDGGRWTTSWRRTQHAYRGDYWRSGIVADQGRDVAHAVGLEGLFFRGRVDLSAGLTGVYNFDRNFESDVFNLNFVLAVHAAL